MESLFVEELRKILKEEQICVKEPMNVHTTFRTGGAAEYYARPSVSQIPQVITVCKEYQIPWMVIGNGSNLLVSDKGIQGLVIEIGKMASEITIEGSTLKAQAGALLSAVARNAANHGLSGMEFAAGIPGTIGGAVVMNAGAYGGEMKDIIARVTVLTPEGDSCVLEADELLLSYRKSCILEHSYLVLSADLLLNPADTKNIEQEMARLRKLRIAKQPLEYPSAGSTFKRPDGYFAGKLIQDAGLRGYQVGGAQVSKKHCGFIINKDNATATDVYQLIQEVQGKVEEKFNVKLEPEVKFIGEF
ncbi:MAG: UDP-N-acetylmuramate dehydrogenase [Lachnospiraceae bacterium]